MLQREELCFQVPRHFTQKQTPKKVKKHTFSAPDDTPMHPTHKMGRQAHMNSTHRHLAHECRRLAPKPPLTCSWCMVLGVCFLWAKAMFCDFLVKKAWYFSPSSGENFPYKYIIPHSQFLIQNKAVQEKANTKSFKRRISFLTEGFSKVCFIYFVICFQLPCVTKYSQASVLR